MIFPRAPVIGEVKRYVVGFEPTRGRLPDPTLTPLSTTSLSTYLSPTHILSTQALTVSRSLSAVLKRRISSSTTWRGDKATRQVQFTHTGYWTRATHDPPSRTCQLAPPLGTSNCTFCGLSSSLLGLGPGSTCAE
ncbi:hypothetical protein E2C01_048308 [Portunus trituberculatus]|uniref:Uncharacterized protein n=1 Tax=Portunus trituberculatus TaxID=210409 RepID=A0A5B7GAT5_PORTR|nr:hypothetical protein [Portunus trituberculatus]